MASVRLLHQGKRQQKEPGERGEVAESSRGRIPLSVQGEATANRWLLRSDPCCLKVQPGCSKENGGGLEAGRPKRMYDKSSGPR